TNEGAGWHAIATIAKAAHNPVALVELKDGRLAAIYGSRETNTKGMYAVLSSDRGKSWSSPIALREDAQTWDFGYPRAFLRPDNVVVVIYYYATKSNPRQHIAATLWTPPDIIEKGQ
ncbi:MAG: glycoside hydrolase, partial [Opitutaceae bacterium]|nr:glycoside hydrolase [Opitutaceae bacterium]